MAHSTVTWLRCLLAMSTFMIITFCFLKAQKGDILVKHVKRNADNSSVASYDRDCSSDDWMPTKKSKLGQYKNAAASDDSELCSSVAKDILVQNGTAVDAAIAAAICDGIFNAQSTGIGGGHFSLIYLRKEKKMIAIDARESAFSAVSVDNYVKNPDFLYKGGLSVAIPGELAGHWRAHQLAGRLPWKKLFEPSIRFCKTGVRVSRVTWSSIKYASDDIKTDPGLKKVFFNSSSNKLAEQGDLIRFEDLARTLEIIADKGPDAFYNGELSKVIVEEINMKGGHFSLNDLRNYRVAERTPIEVRLNDKYRAFVLPPPSAGILVTFVLNLMKRFNLTEDSISTPAKKALYYHRLIEAFKHAYGLRGLLGDSSHVDMQQLVYNLTDDAYIDYVKSRIDDNRTFDYRYYGNDLGKNDKGTSHISVVASNGDAVSMTGSINYLFGALFAGDRTGIIYNNHMDDFSVAGQSNIWSIQPSVANYMKPDKRPMSSMSPIIVLDENDDVRLVLGGCGGSTILSQVASTAISNLWLNKNIKEAVEEPRVHHQLVPENTRVERLFEKDLQTVLQAKGHKICGLSYEETVCIGIERRPNGELWANSDFRKAGDVSGY